MIYNATANNVFTTDDMPDKPGDIASPVGAKYRYGFLVWDIPPVDSNFNNDKGTFRPWKKN
jgi:hypothetical protein